MQLQIELHATLQVRRHEINDERGTMNDERKQKRMRLTINDERTSDRLNQLKEPKKMILPPRHKGTKENFLFVSWCLCGSLF
jgi:hypothetical protein